MILAEVHTVRLLSDPAVETSRSASKHGNRQYLRKVIRKPACINNKIQTRQVANAGVGALTERERDLLQVPHFFVGTLQPL